MWVTLHSADAFFKKRNIWRTNNVETRISFVSISSIKSNTPVCKCHKWSKVCTPEAFKISSYPSRFSFLINFSFLRPYIVYSYRYGNFTAAPHLNCWDIMKLRLLKSTDFTNRRISLCVKIKQCCHLFGSKSQVKTVILTHLYKITDYSVNIFIFSHLADAFIQSTYKWGQQKQSIIVLKQLKQIQN